MALVIQTEGRELKLGSVHMALAMRTKARLRTHGPCELQVSRFGPPKRAGFQVWAPKTSRFQVCKTCRFPGLDPPNVQVSRFGPPQTCRFPKTCRFPGLDPPKRACFQVWIPQTCIPPKTFSRFGPQHVQVSRFGPPKTCRFVQVSRFGPAPKRAGFQVWPPQNVLTCMFGRVQTCKRARFGGGPNLETCTNLHVLGGPNLETCTF